MSKVALYVPLEAKPGKEKEVAEFLNSALPLVEAEPGTVTWFAIQEGPSSFAIFDTFDDEAGRDAQWQGGRCANGEGRRTAGQAAGDSQDRHTGRQASEVDRP
jgi:quinol monooxygenase YgiN